MGQVDKLKAEQKARRVDDPHGWAEWVERELNKRSLIGSAAFVLCIILAANVWLLWQQRDSMLHRLEQVEAVSDLPPVGYDVVN